MKTTKQIAAIAVFTALVTAMTIVVAIPIPGAGYFNVGDAVIYITAACLGPIGGMFAGGVGSLIADLALGYTAYAPFTFFIKGIEGLVVALIIKLITKAIAGKSDKYIVHIGIGVAAMVIGAAIMVLGYMGAGAIIGGKALVIAELPTNCVQGAVGVGIGAAIVYALNLPKIARRYGFEVSVGAWFRKKDKTQNVLEANTVNLESETVDESKVDVPCEIKSKNE